MKLREIDRERLYEAGGKPIEVWWPEEPEPRKGKRYGVYGEDGKLFTIRVEAIERIPYEIRCRVRVDHDPVRTLPGLQGVRTEEGDYESEPERVHAVYEEQFAKEAATRVRLRRAERTGTGKLANEYAAREAKRLEAP